MCRNMAIHVCMQVCACMCGHACVAMRVFSCVVMRVVLKSPRRRREKKVINKTLSSRYRCVPKIASPEGRKGECTTNLQRPWIQESGLCSPGGARRRARRGRRRRTGEGEGAAKVLETKPQPRGEEKREKGIYPSSY